MQMLVAIEKDRNVCENTKRERRRPSLISRCPMTSPEERLQGSITF